MYMALPLFKKLHVLNLQVLRARTLIMATNQSELRGVWAGYQKTVFE